MATCRGQARLCVPEPQGYLAPRCLPHLGCRKQGRVASRVKATSSASKARVKAASPASYVSHVSSRVSSIDMYNNDVSQESAQKFMKQTGDLKAATLYFAS